MSAPDLQGNPGLDTPVTERVQASPPPAGETSARADDEGETSGDPWMQSHRGQRVDSSEFRQFLNFVEARSRGQYPPRNTSSRDRPGHRSYASQDSGDDRDDGERTNAGPPPSFDGTGFKDFQIRAKLWLATTKSKPRTRGPLLLKNMTGTAFDNFKHLAKDDSWLSNPLSGQLLLDQMDTREYYGDDSREDMLNCLGKLTYQLKRNKGEGQRDFCARWENAVRKVKEHGVQLPPEYLGFLFIMALQLLRRK